MIFKGIAHIGWVTRSWLADIGHAARFFVRLLSFAPDCLRRFGSVSYTHLTLPTKRIV